MSRAVRRQLADLTERGERRRHKTSEIRQQSEHLIERLHRLCQELGQESAILFRGARLEMVVVEESEAEGSHVQGLPGVDVLEQVNSLLSEVDARDRDYWTEDDTRILLCLQEAWSIAARKGYTLEDLQAVLRFLAPPR